MTRQDFPKLSPGTVLAAGALLAAVLAASGFERKADHQRDIERVERKLDCALFDLPRGCRETMSPRGP